ncbi:ABC transporter ATP-binding protein [Kitasatospora sp. NPDC101157]|uniref:ABC transporter ATP-binding protein n=1 Tax=Kitasatospora sp. NPDC101157 TaxID=3364098 RepID=UPI00381AE846
MTETPSRPGGSPRTAATPAAVAVDLTKVHGTGDARVAALERVSVAFRTGEFAAIMGPSGSGKSTLLHCLAGLESCTSGTVRIGDADLTRLTDRRLTKLRRDHLGFVFQSFHLIPTLTVLENITLPLVLAGRTPDRQWLSTVIDAAGLGPRLAHRPAQLSGGQQQRVACARALAGRPRVVFADEPTGNLDSRSAAEILHLLRRCVRELGQTIVMVTHDPIAAGYADRVVFLADGRIVDELAPPTPDQVLQRMHTFDTNLGISHWSGP